MIKGIIKDFSDIDHALKAIDSAATNALSGNRPLYFAYGTDNKMTQAQRGALHVWCDQVASVLNDFAVEHDEDMYRRTVNPFTGAVLHLPWDKDSVKQDLYKPTLKAYKGKLSTENQNTVEPSVIAEALSRAYAKHFGVPLPPWPSNRG